MGNVDSDQGSTCSDHSWCENYSTETYEKIEHHVCACGRRLRCSHECKADTRCDRCCELHNTFTLTCRKCPSEVTRRVPCTCALSEEALEAYRAKLAAKTLCPECTDAARLTRRAAYDARNPWMTCVRCVNRYRASQLDGVARMCKPCQATTGHDCSVTYDGPSLPGS